MLPARERDPLLLLAWAELSYEEIADALRLPLGTVRSRLSRGRARLRLELDAGPGHVTGDEGLAPLLSDAKGRLTCTTTSSICSSPSCARRCRCATSAPAGWPASGWPHAGRRRAGAAAWPFRAWQLLRQRPRWPSRSSRRPAWATSP